jgi:hypothetical protein
MIFGIYTALWREIRRAKLKKRRSDKKPSKIRAKFYKFTARTALKFHGARLKR